MRHLVKAAFRLELVQAAVSYVSGQLSWCASSCILWYSF